MPRNCPRCHAALPSTDEASAAFCPACGLPQLRVPIEALEPPDAAATHPATAGSTLSAHAMDWRLALRILAIASVFGVLPCALDPTALITGGAGIFAIFLLPLLTLGSGAADLRRRPFPAFTPAIGARMGVVLALLVSTALTVLCGLAGFIAAYGMHSHVVPATLDLAFQQFTDQRKAFGTPLPPEWTAAIAWPEMRAGAFLFTQAMVCAVLLVVGAVSGAAAGALLGARQRRSKL